MHKPKYIQEDWDRLRFRIYDDSQWFPAQAVVCRNCRGRGKTVNPSIDGNGLTAEDFAEDPDFMRDYRSGVYDVSCCECSGRGMNLEPTTDDGWLEFNEYVEDMAEMRATYLAETRMGA